MLRWQERGEIPEWGYWEPFSLEGIMHKWDGLHRLSVYPSICVRDNFSKFQNFETKLACLDSSSLGQVKFVIRAPTERRLQKRNKNFQRSMLEEWYENWSSGKSIFIGQGAIES